jgi:hypothetical protein
VTTAQEINSSAAALREIEDELLFYDFTFLRWADVLVFIAPQVTVVTELPAHHSGTPPPIAGPPTVSAGPDSKTSGSSSLVGIPIPLDLAGPTL